MKNYELIEHTADIGVRVQAGSIEDLFKVAAYAMFDIIAKKKNIQDNNVKVIDIKQSAANLEELFVNWLNELLSLSATKEVIFSKFKIDKLDDNGIKAVGEGVAVESYTVNTEIKAATYHGLKVEKVGAVWQAEVIFDV